jgi:ferredoxin-NADP reductase
VLIAGGIGITPLRSILDDLAARQPRARTTLLYSNARADFPFRAFFDGLVSGWPALHVVYTVTRPTADWQGSTGRIDAEFIQRHLPNLSRPVYFVCGPAALVDSMRGHTGRTGRRSQSDQARRVPRLRGGGRSSVDCSQVIHAERPPPEQGNPRCLRVGRGLPAT